MLQVIESIEVAAQVQYPTNTMAKLSAGPKMTNEQFAD